ncbi:MAG: helix-turn-helix domain-containing protein [Clostridium sp.]|nr:helix-turn-helix domain-containing protein [Clostridium sp.]MCM1547867.1 helix-turn-helix domain-containing protein [Ruminococcus sp.]
MDVGKRIKTLREAKGLTVNKLANIAGISQSFLRDVELGNKNPTVETLSYFCDALGVSLSDFFDENDTKINPFLKSAIKKLNNTQQIKLAEFINSLW